MEFIDHGFGVIEFPEAVSIDQSFLKEWTERRRAEQPDDYVLQEDGTYLNRGGYSFTAEQIAEAPRRILKLGGGDKDDVDFYQTIFDGMTRCVEQYQELFPEVTPCVWWRTYPHLAIYEVGGNMGFHHDNLVGDGEKSATSILTVLTGSMVLNDDFEGGDLVFKYPEISLAPKAGGAVIYSAGYLGTHAVEPVTSGSRISYLEFFGHGHNEGGQDFTKPASE